MPSIKLNNKLIDKESFPYIIAEIGVNHDGSLKKAIELINSAAEAGADAAKFQTYKADLLAAKDSPAYWDMNLEKTKTQNELFKKYDQFKEKEYRVLHEHCIKKNIEFLTTPFDINSLEYLDDLLNFYKIASADINNFPLLKSIANKNKPIILSTGASNLDEIKFAVNFLFDNNCPNVSLLHCVLNYPTAYKNANLSMIEGLTESFPNLVIGYSDHTLPDESMLTLLTSYMKGARIIEKHFTLDKSMKGNDHYHAMNGLDLKILIKNLKKIIHLGGNKKKFSLDSEGKSRINARRSIVANNNLEKNSIIKESDLITKRPGTGIKPDNWNNIIGKKVNKKIKKDSILLWEDILDS